MAKKMPKKTIVKQHTNPFLKKFFPVLIFAAILGAVLFIAAQLTARQAVAPNAPESEPAAANVTCGSSLATANKCGWEGGCKTGEICAYTGGGESRAFTASCKPSNCTEKPRPTSNRCVEEGGHCGVFSWNDVRQCCSGYHCGNGKIALNYTASSAVGQCIADKEPVPSGTKECKWSQCYQGQCKSYNMTFKQSSTCPTSTCKGSNDNTCAGTIIKPGTCTTSDGYTFASGQSYNQCSGNCPASLGCGTGQSKSRVCTCKDGSITCKCSTVGSGVANTKVCIYKTCSNNLCKSISKTVNISSTCPKSTCTNDSLCRINTGSGSTKPPTYNIR